MSKVKYTEADFKNAVKLRAEGKTNPQITVATGIKAPSLKKYFAENKIPYPADKSANQARWDESSPFDEQGCLKCGKCERRKEPDQFSLDSTRRSGKCNTCISCMAAYYDSKAEELKASAKEYRDDPENKDKIAIKRVAYHAANNVEITARATVWNKDNPVRRKEIKTAYDKRTQPQKNARTANYRAGKDQRTPVWAEIDLIKEFYKNCPKGYHVDHIIPLRGAKVSGLHVFDNLQYLPGEENVRKGNKF